MTILESLRDLEAKLEGELLNVPAYQSLKVIRRAIADIVEAEGARSANGSIPAADPRRRGSKNRQTAVDACFAYLSDQPSPIKTAGLIQHLETLKITLNGSSPVSNLSAALGADGRFMRTGREGWRLASSIEQERPHPTDRPDVETEQDDREQPSESR